MRVDSFSIQGVVFMLSLVVAAPTWAAGCQSESPNLQASQSVWTPVSASAVSLSMQNRILGFLAGLEGDWQGSGGTTACVMEGDNAVSVRAPERIRLTVTRNGQASFDFHFSIYDRRNNVTTGYNFMLEKQGQALQVAGEGNIAVSEFYDGGIRFRTQTAMRTGFRRSIGKGTAHTVLSLETVRRLVLQDGELSFYKAVFHNGAMIDYSHWTFNRGS